MREEKMENKADPLPPPHKLGKTTKCQMSAALKPYRKMRCLSPGEQKGKRKGTLKRTVIINALHARGLPKVVSGLANFTNAY
jgi:hypothetical protein